MKPKEITEFEEATGFVYYGLNFDNYYQVDKDNRVIMINLSYQYPVKSNFLDYFKYAVDILAYECGIEELKPKEPLLALEKLLMGANKLSRIEIDAPNLKELIVWSNNISNLSDILKFKKLEKLNIDYNDIGEINDLIYLNKLKVLSLTQCGIQTLEPLISLFHLKGLFAYGNDIRTVSHQLAAKFKFEFILDDYFLDEAIGINVQENPLEFPPTSVILLGQNAIKNYYLKSEQYGHAALSEGRVIVIGDGSSGKSSLIERVLYRTHDENKKQTNGIKIENWHLTHEDGRDLTFHFWDFGGQEIQHAVHKFFFTEGCLYVLVLDNRKEEEPEYWLQQIESLGGNAPVLVVFNKQDENTSEATDRKFLKEKYPNIVGFFNTSCRSGFGLEDFKSVLEKEVVKLRTVNERFPNNWLAIKRELEQYTSGEGHYLTYEAYQQICLKNEISDEETQKLLLRYFNTIGSITWFGGDTYLKFLHVLNPAWITQGVYKILTSKKTVRLYGQIHIDDFKEMLYPVSDDDYTYDEQHYGYILAMMKKFDMCDTKDDRQILIPSAFGKEPKVEYKDFKGQGVRTYMLQFKDYMPLALIHRYTAKKLPDALDSNYWYTGIVVKDNKSETLSMVHMDKEAKRMYVRVKGEAQLGMWESFRRDFQIIADSYAQINFEERVALDGNEENYVEFEDLVGHLAAGKQTYFHSRLRKEFNVGYLMGLFQDKESTIDEIKEGVIQLDSHSHHSGREKIPQIVLQILNNVSPTISNQVTNSVHIDIQLVQNVVSDLKGDLNFLKDELSDNEKELKECVDELLKFAEEAKKAKAVMELKEKGWGRKLKKTLTTFADGGDAIKKIADGGEVLKSIFSKISDLANQFQISDIEALIKALSQNVN